MSKKIVIGIIVVILAIALAIGIVVIVNKNKKEISELPESITITQYTYTNEKPSTVSNTVLKELKIESKEDIEKFAKCVEKIKPLSANEMVDLYMPFEKGEVEIKYGDDITIRIMLREKYYCTYENTKTNELELVKMPDGLYELVETSLETAPYYFEKPSSITITQYSYTAEKPRVISDTVLKEVKIESAEGIEKFAECITKIRALTTNEMVDLYIPFEKGEVEIKYGDDVTIRIVLTEKHYCTYENKKTNKLELVRMPDGLYELVNETLSK